MQGSTGDKETIELACRNLRRDSMMGTPVTPIDARAEPAIGKQ